MKSVALKCSVCILLYAWTSSEAFGAGVRILFPNSSIANLPVRTSHRPVPLEEEIFDEKFQSMANSLATINDFAKFFNVSLPKPKPSIEVRINVGRVPLEVDQAVCTPELTPVTLNIPKEKGVSFFPTCVRVERCGGCCFLPYHSCQATKTETIFVKSVKVQEEVTRSRRRRVRNAEPNFISVEVEKHNLCECKCKLQANDCNLNIQTYDEHQCACVCVDRNKELECLTKRDHFWKNDSCECLCRKTVTCSSGRRFDHENCSCR